MSAQDSFGSETEPPNSRLNYFKNRSAILESVSEGSPKARTPEDRLSLSYNPESVSPFQIFLQETNKNSNGSPVLRFEACFAEFCHFRQLTDQAEQQESRAMTAMCSALMELHAGLSVTQFRTFVEETYWTRLVATPNNPYTQFAKLWEEVSPHLNSTEVFASRMPSDSSQAPLTARTPFMPSDAIAFIPTIIASGVPSAAFAVAQPGITMEPYSQSRTPAVVSQRMPMETPPQGRSEIKFSLPYLDPLSFLPESDDDDATFI